MSRMSKIVRVVVTQIDGKRVKEAGIVGVIGVMAVIGTRIVMLLSVNWLRDYPDTIPCTAASAMINCCSTVDGQ